MTSSLLPADEAFWAALNTHVVDAAGSILLLERWARGAGQRSWFLLTTASDVDVALKAVRPGSSLTAYFRPDLPVHGVWSEQLVEAAKAQFERLGPNEELVALVDRGERPTLEFGYLTDATELESWNLRVMSDPVWIGKYPDWPADGEDAITRVVADADGVVRSHPY